MRFVNCLFISIESAPIRTKERRRKRRRVESSEERLATPGVEPISPSHQATMPIPPPVETFVPGRLISHSTGVLIIIHVYFAIVKFTLVW